MIQTRKVKLLVSRLFFFLVIFKQRINDYALYFKTFHSRISSWYPLVNFNSFLLTYASFSWLNHVWSRNQLFWKVSDFFGFLRSSSVSSWLIHCSSSLSFFSDSLWLRFGAKKLSNVWRHFQCHMLQSSQVKRTPQNSINEFIIRKLSPLAVVDFRFISAFLHA